jgi:hypothetical protein
MRIFAIKEILEIKGKITLYKMIVDGVCLFDEFLNEVEYDGNLTGRIIVCGGKKSNQKSDIRRFRKLKKEYLSKKK